MRKQISISPGEVRAFLMTQHQATLATVGSDGVPHQVTITYAVIDDAVRFTSFRRAQKIRNARRDPRASLLVEVTSPYSLIRGVLVRGELTLSDNYDDVLAVIRHLAAQMGRADPETSRTNPDIDLEATAATRVAITFDLAGVTSWDHTQLGAGIY